MRDLLLDLPLEVTLNLLGDWVGLRSLALLDVAYNNKEKRQSYRHLLQSKELVVHDNNVYSDDYNMFLVDWVFLRGLKFSYFVFGYETTNCLTDDKLARFVKANGKTLKTFGMHIESPGYTMWWNAIADECSQLEELELEILGGPDPSVLTHILSRNSRTLRKVDILIDDFEADMPADCAFPHVVEFHARAEVKLNGLEGWTERCPQLRRFALDTRFYDMRLVLDNLKKHCQQIASINMLQIINENVADIIHHCPKGPALHLMFDPQTSETSIVNCLFRLTNVQSVTFLINDQMNDGCMAALKSFSASSLRKLSINSCNGATGGSLLELVTACKNLSILYLNKGPVLPAVQLAKMIVACPTLTRLSLIESYEVNNTVLSAIGANLAELTFLNIETGLNDHHYTLKGIRALLQGCPKLTTLCLGVACTKVIGPKARAEFQKLYPALRIEHQVTAEWEIDDSDEIQ